MRTAPAVQVPVGGGLHWRRFVSWIGAAAGATTAAWFSQLLRAPVLSVTTDMSTGAAAAVGALLGVLAARRFLRLPEGLLAWTGRCWTWSARQENPAQPLNAPAREGELQVLLDFGPALLMLLSLAPPGPRPRRLWIALTREQAGPAWHALRAAIYSRRPEADEPAAPPT